MSFTLDIYHSLQFILRFPSPRDKEKPLRETFRIGVNSLLYGKLRHLEGLVRVRLQSRALLIYDFRFMIRSTLLRTGLKKQTQSKPISCPPAQSSRNGLTEMDAQQWSGNYVPLWLFQSKTWRRWEKAKPTSLHISATAGDFASNSSRVAACGINITFPASRSPTLSRIS